MPIVYELDGPTSAGALFLGQAAFVILALLALEKVAYKKHMVAWAEQSCGEDDKVVLWMNTVSPPVNDCNMRQPKMR
ncbi:uncharacterized protein LOC103977288 isoform X5 [Musa acuminata AAA Group]|uniref:uncharacterized protein LOC103977288 isoform X5 n=1 Tax=Musa acuminata AAA Group TaxID=214697 RepID=UPI0031CDE837